MSRNRSKSGGRPHLPMVPPAAAIDIGATMQMAAVRANPHLSPYAVLIPSLLICIDWSTGLGMRGRDGRRGIDSVHRIPIFELLDARRFTDSLSTRAMPGTCAGARPMSATRVAAAAPFVRVTASRLSAQRGDCRTASLRASARASAGASTSHVQHMQKARIEMNLQIHHVVADMIGGTGLRIIRAILVGEGTPETPARLRHYSCHSSLETIAKAAYRALPRRPSF